MKAFIYKKTYQINILLSKFRMDIIFYYETDLHKRFI